MRVVWTLGAQENARSLVSLLAARSTSQAGRLAEALAVAAERLTEFARLGVASDQGVRCLMVLGGQYRLIYRLGDGEIRILGIGRGAQAWPIHAG